MIFWALRRHKRLAPIADARIDNTLLPLHSREHKKQGKDAVLKVVIIHRKGDFISPLGIPARCGKGLGFRPKARRMRFGSSLVGGLPDAASAAKIITLSFVGRQSLSAFRHQHLPLRACRDELCLYKYFNLRKVSWI